MSTATTTDKTLAAEAVKTIKFLSADAVEKANSGHPGMPMGAADMGYVLWTRFLRYDPAAPDWEDRDRFILSAGHGCMLLYSLLHLSGYDLSMDDLKSFRQWGSKTPGHPEFGHTVGVEATTGPLGQGVSNAVGMALSTKMLQDRFNDADFQPVSQRTFVIASDGDIMEGISGEAASLAGHLKLSDLVVLYDDNEITIEGETGLAFSEDVCGRYASYGWHTQKVDGHDHDALAQAIEAAIASDRPALIACKTHIGHGAPTKQDSASSHGSPLGAEELAGAKKAEGWPEDRSFHVPDEVRELFEARAAEGAAQHAKWKANFARWRAEQPDKAQQWDAIVHRVVPADITERLLANAPDSKAATRAHGGVVLQQAAELVPGLVGGSADLEPSNKTRIKSSGWVAPGDYSGRNFHYGVREHAMGAVVNGMLYHGSFRPFGATFLVFADYMRPSIRLAALANLPAIFVFTHDSIFVGEDGPTHEPIEHAFALRCIPNLNVFRPADGYETALAWGMALERQDGPTTMLLTRQGVPPIQREATGELADPRRGAYLVAGDANPDAIVVATGSEVHLAMAARETLKAEGKSLSVISAPCMEIFDAQDAAYRNKLFPAGVPIASVEAGIAWPWRALTGHDGLTLGIDHYGASAPANVLAEKFGFTEESVTRRIREWMA